MITNALMLAVGQENSSALRRASKVRKKNFIEPRETKGLRVKKNEARIGKISQC